MNRFFSLPAPPEGLVRSSDRLQAAVDFLFDRVLVNLLRGLFVAILLAPALAAFCVWSFKEPPVGLPRYFAGIVALLGQIDSGYQLASNSFYLRFALLALGGLTVLLGLPVPREGRWMWRCSWVFIGVATLSGALSSHPYEALLTAFDTALLNLVVLVAFHFSPRGWVPLAYTVSAAVTALLSLGMFFGGELFTADDGRLNGSFFQPNVMAAFLAAALPCLINRYLGARGWPRLQIVAYFAVIPVYLAFVLTGTRAAMLVALLCLGARWWLGACLRRGSGPLSALLQTGGFLALLLLTCYYSVFSGVGLILGLVLLALAAYRSGLQIVPLAGLLLLCLAAYSVQGAIAKMKENNLNGITRRVTDLQKGSDASLSSRKEFWRAALVMGLDHPGLGVGPRGFHRYYPSYQADEHWFSKFAHSACISCFAEMGIPGALLLLILSGQWLWAVVGGIQRLKGVIRPLSALEPGPGPVGGGDRAPASQWDGKTVDQLLDAATSATILALCMSVDVQWQFPVLPVVWAAWLGASLSLAWPEVPPAPPPQAVEDISPWTLRPQVVFTYFLLAVLGVAAAADLSFGMAQQYNEAAELWMRRGEVARALDCDLAAVRFNPFQGSYFHHYGLSYSAALATKMDKVTAPRFLQIAERAVQLDSHRAVHWDLLHKALRANKRPDLARTALQHALECDPVNYPSFYIGLAELLEAPADRSQKERVLMACVQRFPSESLSSMFSFRSSDIVRQLCDAYMLLADLTDRNHPELALSYYDQFLKLQPDEPNARLGRIVCLINLNRLPDAHREALALYKKLPQAEIVDVLKHIYEMERLPFKPEDFPVSKAPQPKQP